MFGLLELLALALLVLLAIYHWQSGFYKSRALELAQAHCHRLNLQLLDQSMVIVGLWPVRGGDGRIRLRRRYQFEFATLGDRRYRGELVLLAATLRSIDLEAYKLPLDE